MAEKTKQRARDRVGYGSSYRKGTSHDLKQKGEIGAVLGGQVWLIRPDKKGQSANPCIWMQAGVVEFKNCNNFYDCTTCKYDMGMRKKASQGKQMTWQDAMRRRSGLERICRHSLTQRIGKRQCAYDYECSRCDFDQFFEDVWTTKTGAHPGEVHSVKGFDVPMGYYFHNGHTWARIESGGYIRVGMDDFALKLLGKADAFDLPLLGKELDQGIPGWGLKRGNNSADVLSPVDGVIVEVNSDVKEKTGVTNGDPYGEGWLFVLRHPNLKKAMKNLMDDTRGIQWMANEVAKLEGMIEEVAGPLAADGGHLSEDIFGNLPDLGWGNLTRTFLKT
ncbi:MAG: glycine cleavage system protein H [Deltaproteobacteria bacterium]|nr:glycine cleavage system protein H [Deltaproteobacteria bacterium]MBW2082052.1 glycine cleavage system protein H [Deltaproteobacteria bacterium]HDM10358.1 glycine cleavage system protein H [Desulfobacteraceae bacterium]